MAKEAEWQVLQQYYPTLFFFSAQALAENQPLYIELEKIYRQADEAFISVLNHKIRFQHVEAGPVVFEAAAMGGF